MEVSRYVVPAFRGGTGLFAQYDKDVFFMRGRQALADGKYALAIENFNVLSRLDTTDYWNFFFRGIAKYNLGDLRGAKSDFDRSVRHNPVFTSGYHYRGITESRFGNYEAALEDLQKAIDLRPGYSRPVFQPWCHIFPVSSVRQGCGRFRQIYKERAERPFCLS